MVPTPFLGREAKVLRDRIRRWEAQLRECEAWNLRELAREIRESLPWYRRKLRRLEASLSRRVA